MFYIQDIFLRLYRFLIGLILLNLVSCTPDDAVGPVSNNESSTIESIGVFILNEGNFQSGNGSLSFYNPNNKTVSQEVFSNSNGIPLGDVPQSISILNEEMYVIVNNSNKIEIIDPENAESIATIAGFTSPRYILQVNDVKAYLSDLYSNKISVINLTTRSISSTIELEGWSEEMIFHNGYAYIQNIGQKKVIIIDPVTDQIIKDISFQNEPIGIVKTSDGVLYTLTKDGLFKLEGTPQFPVLSQLIIANLNAPTRLRLDSINNQIYFIDQHVFKIDLSSPQIDIKLWKESNGENYYGLGIDPSNSDVYVTNAKDFVQKGSVERFDAEGNLIDWFQVGIIPQDIFVRTF